MISQEYVKSVLDYDERTGVLTWLHRHPDMFNRRSYAGSWNAKNAGKKAGSIKKYMDGKTYITLRLNGKEILSHRVIMLYMTGSIPEQVDHINGDGTDNRWVNLRPADKIINARNHRRQSNNKSGVAGVVYCKRDDRWIATIGIGGKRVIVKSGKDKDAVIAARKAAEKEHGYSVGHGTERSL